VLRFRRNEIDQTEDMLQRFAEMHRRAEAHCDEEALLEAMTSTAL